MREIIFKAKRIDNGEWVEGSLTMAGREKAWILKAPCTLSMAGRDLKTDFDVVPVDPNTVCQYTNLKDKNGVMIFEGDVIRWRVCEDSVEHTDTIEYYNGWWLGGGYIYDLPWSLNEVCESGIVEVIGNKFDGEV